MEGLSVIVIEECDEGALLVVEDLYVVDDSSCDVVEESVEGYSLRQVSEVEGPPLFVLEGGEESHLVAQPGVRLRVVCVVQLLRIDGVHLSPSEVN